MKEWMIGVVEYTITAINVVAFVFIVIGTIVAIVACIRLAFKRDPTGTRLRKVWINYSHWLVAGLTFQLAADIIESSIAPDWQSIGMLGAIAVIRTFLNYFLSRDVGEISERQHELRTMQAES